MMLLATTKRALPPTLPRTSRIVALPVARPHRATTKCLAADPSKDAAKKDKIDKDGYSEAARKAQREKREKFLAGVKIPDESQATKKGIRKGDPNP